MHHQIYQRRKARAELLIEESLRRAAEIAGIEWPEPPSRPPGTPGERVLYQRERWAEVLEALLPKVQRTVQRRDSLEGQLARAQGKEKMG